VEKGKRGRGAGRRQGDRLLREPRRTACQTEGALNRSRESGKKEGSLLLRDFEQALVRKEKQWSEKGKSTTSPEASRGRTEGKVLCLEEVFEPQGVPADWKKSVHYPKRWGSVVGQREPCKKKKVGFPLERVPEEEKERTGDIWEGGECKETRSVR